MSVWTPSMRKKRWGGNPCIGVALINVIVQRIRLSRIRCQNRSFTRHDMPSCYKSFFIQPQRPTQPRSYLSTHIRSENVRCYRMQITPTLTRIKQIQHTTTSTLRKCTCALYMSTRTQRSKDHQPVMRICT